jgi:hypothetical protein
MKRWISIKGRVTNHPNIPISRAPEHSVDAFCSYTTREAAVHNRSSVSGEVYTRVHAQARGSTIRHTKTHEDEDSLF